MQPGHQLYGFEKDINRLIDVYALQAEKDGCASFQTFKKLFQLAGFAYLHQAYPGCEHNPEYIQLLYATALDRLDAVSPTAPADSPLWKLHASAASASQPTTQAAAAAAAAAAAGTRSLAAAEQLHTAPGYLTERDQAIAMIQSHAQAQGMQQQQQQQQLSSAQTSAGIQQMGAGDYAAQQQQQQQVQSTASPSPCFTHSQQPQGVPGLDPSSSVPPWPGPAPQQVPNSDLHLQRVPPVVPGVSQLQAQVQQPPPLGQQQQQGITAVAGLDMPLLLPEDDFGDEFLDDLLAIFDQAEAEEVRFGMTAGDVRAATDLSAAQQPQQQPVSAAAAVVIPVAVKAAAVFMLHCLHETQLNRPAVRIYVPLSSLKALVTAAAEFRSARPRAADALLVLQLLLSHQRLLVGQFRRPRHWQVPQHLQPRHGAVDVGLGSAAANSAATRASMDEWRVAAVKAAAAAARSMLCRVNTHHRQDTAEHREAMFHIKMTLNSFSNIRSMQSLCDEYADARRAIFETVLALRERVQQRQAAAAPATTEQHGHQDEPQEEWWQKPKRGKGAKQKAAAQQKKSDPRPSLPPLAAPPSTTPVWEGAAQKWSATGNPHADVPDLFDRSFGTDLQSLACDEAARMFVLLDPAYDASRLKKRQREQQAVAASPAASTSHEQQSNRQQGCTSLPERRWACRYMGDMAAAGICQPRELQEMQQGTGQAVDVVKGLGVPQKVLQLQADRQQRAVRVAEEWFAAHDAMLGLGGSDEGEDMP